MPRYGPTKRRDLIAALKKLGFSDPQPGGIHQYMRRGPQKVNIPNPHEGDISIELLARILRRIGITHQEWEAL